MVTRSNAACWEHEIRGSWEPVAQPLLNRPYADLSAHVDSEIVKAFRRQHPTDCLVNDMQTNATRSKRCFHSSALYEWRPAGLPHMRAVQADCPMCGGAGPALCRALLTHGYRRLIFIGDSITRNQANSLWGLIGNWRFSTFEGFGYQKLRCEHGSSISIELFPNPAPGKLALLLNATTNVGDLKSTTINLTEEKVNRIVSTVELQQLWSALNDSSAVCIFNAGPHYAVDLEGTRRLFMNQVNTSGQMFRAFLRDTLGLRLLLRHHRAGGRFIYRTTPWGHPGCETFAAGPPDYEDPAAAYDRWGFRCRDCEVAFDAFGWHMFPAFDRAARHILEPLGVHFLDITILSASRPDGHTAFRHGGGRLPPDCLHWSLPGVPDVWNYLLIGGLQHCLHRPHDDSSV